MFAPPCQDVLGPHRPAFGRLSPFRCEDLEPDERRALREARRYLARRSEGVTFVPAARRSRPEEGVDLAT